jgi:hypothetical protein
MLLEYMTTPKEEEQNTIIIGDGIFLIPSLPQIDGTL